jgi:hypothetical protein
MLSRGPSPVCYLSLYGAMAGKLRFFGMDIVLV